MSAVGFDRQPDGRLGVVVVALVQQLRRMLAAAAVRRRLERVTAGLMVGFGLRLALERR
jgi:hypothetical protein